MELGDSLVGKSRRRSSGLSSSRGRAGSDDDATAAAQGDASGWVSSLVAEVDAKAGGGGEEDEEDEDEDDDDEDAMVVCRICENPIPAYAFAVHSNACVMASIHRMQVVEIDIEIEKRVAAIQSRMERMRSQRRHHRRRESRRLSRSATAVAIPPVEEDDAAAGVTAAHDALRRRLTGDATGGRGRMRSSSFNDEPNEPREEIRTPDSEKNAPSRRMRRTSSSGLLASTPTLGDDETANTIFLLGAAKIVAEQALQLQGEHITNVSMHACSKLLERCRTLIVQSEEVTCRTSTVQDAAEELSRLISRKLRALLAVDAMNQDDELEKAEAAPPDAKAFAVVASPDVFASAGHERTRTFGHSRQSSVAMIPSIRDFVVLKPISRGVYGSVYLARKKTTGDVYAIKVIPKAHMLAKEMVDTVFTELNIMSRAGTNPHVVKLFFSFESKRNLYLVMEYLPGGDCYNLLRNLGALSEPHAREYVAEAVLGLDFLHRMGVVHRDMKPDNMLISTDGRMKLTDFGLSKAKRRSAGVSSAAAAAASHTGDDEALRRRVGTPDYLAPETLRGSATSGPAADWWSLGAILFEFLLGTPPFHDKTPADVFRNVLDHKPPLDFGEFGDEISPEARDLINALLEPDPERRLGGGPGGAADVKTHPWFADLDWERVGTEAPPFVPDLEGEEDTDYFDQKGTGVFEGDDDWDDDVPVVGRSPIKYASDSDLSRMPPAEGASGPALLEVHLSGDNPDEMIFMPAHSVSSDSSDDNEKGSKSSSSSSSASSSQSEHDQPREATARLAEVGGYIHFDYGHANLASLSTLQDKVGREAERLRVLHSARRSREMPAMTRRARTPTPSSGTELTALDRLLRGLPYEHYHRVVTEDSRGRRPMSRRNLVILSRWPILSSKQFKNDKTPMPLYRRMTADPCDEEATGITWERPGLYAHIDLGHGLTLHVINMHLKSKHPTPISGQVDDEKRKWLSASGWAEGSFISAMKRLGQALEARIIVDEIFDKDPQPLMTVCGDFNEGSESVPVQAICGDEAMKTNSTLGSRVLMHCEQTIADSRRFTIFHHGTKHLVDHLLASRALLAFYRGTEIHNEFLHDQSVRYPSSFRFAESDHAPLITTFVLPVGGAAAVASALTLSGKAPRPNRKTTRGSRRDRRIQSHS